jgi:hypothetical protein
MRGPDYRGTSKPLLPPIVPLFGTRYAETRPKKSLPGGASAAIATFRETGPRQPGGTSPQNPPAPVAAARSLAPRPWVRWREHGATKDRSAATLARGLPTRCTWPPLPVAARSRCVRLASVWRQGYPSPAYPKQFAVFAGHRLVAECFNFLRGDAGPAHRLDHMIDDAKVVAGRVKRDADVGMFGGHF